MLHQKWIVLVYTVYLALVCFVSGIFVLAQVVGVAHNVLQLCWPELYVSGNYIPELLPVKRALLESAINIVLVGLVWGAHCLLLRRLVRRNKEE